MTKPRPGETGACVENSDDGVSDSTVLDAPTSPTYPALSVRYDGAALTDAERVALRRARRDARASARGRARQMARRS